MNALQGEQKSHVLEHNGLWLLAIMYLISVLNSCDTSSSGSVGRLETGLGDDL